MPAETAIIPCLRYVDAPAAIEFLCRAFGFERHAIHADPANPQIIHHAQLVLGPNMVMLGSARPDGQKDLYNWRTPAEAGGVTVTLYVMVPDIEAHFARASAAGAKLLTGLKNNEGYPGQAYAAQDPESNLWSFSDYNPWI